MKYFHDDGLGSLTKQLTDLSVGSQRVLQGRLEAYTMKRVSEDHKFAAQLGIKYIAALEEKQQQLVKPQQRKRSYSTGEIVPIFLPPARKKNRSISFDQPEEGRNRDDCGVDVLAASQLGDFSEQGTRRLMTDLILTLNMSFPDYDFGSVRPSDFQSMSLPQAEQHVQRRLSNVAIRSENFFKDLWQSLDSVLEINACDVYSYTGTEWAQALTGDTVAMWSFNYFFVNRARKRLVLFTCVESMESSSVSGDEQGGDEVTHFEGRDQEEDDFGHDEFSDYVCGDELTTSESADVDLDPASSRAGGIPVHTV